MSRPKPEILLEYKSNDYAKAEQVLLGEAIYAVFYQNKPINLRTLTDTLIDNGPKYKKTSFANPGHAFNLAEKLNKTFRTKDFAVFKLTDGVEVQEAAEKN